LIAVPVAKPAGELAHFTSAAAPVALLEACEALTSP
jgi:hypothetical protein